ncbi:MAG: (Fe-S)-binding protein [Syntrophorhabdus sp.]
MMMPDTTYKFHDVIHRCFRCGYCKFPTNWTDVNNCPPYARFRMEPYSCGGRLWLTRAWLNETLDWSEHLAEILYSCTTCRNCEVKCPLSFNVDIVNMIVAARGEMVERGKIPVALKRFLENIDLHGNPYGVAKNKRDAWMDGMGMEPYTGQEYLYYIGCTGSYDTRAQNAARAVGKLLRAAGVSFGVLGNDENCDGNEVHKLGEAGLFDMLAEENIAHYKDLGVTKIITLSPHAYNAMKNLYPGYGGSFRVFHYAQILLELINAGKLKLSHEFNAQVTYHDPCFLGRWNSEYEVPRRLLAKIPSLQLVEMEKNREGALCCGGGAGNFEIDLLGGSESSPARRRVRQAIQSGANVLAVACPKCLVMLEDALKAEDLEGKLVIRDISEIVIEAGGMM